MVSTADFDSASSGSSPGTPAHHIILCSDFVDRYRGRNSVVEYRSFKPGVVGSTPTAPTKSQENTHG